MQNYCLGEQELVMALLSQLNDEVLEQVEGPVLEREQEQDARSRAQSLGLRVIKGGRDSGTVH